MVFGRFFAASHFEIITHLFQFGNIYKISIVAVIIVSYFPSGKYHCTHNGHSPTSSKSVFPYRIQINDRHSAPLSHDIFIM